MLFLFFALVSLVSVLAGREFTPRTTSLDKRAVDVTICINLAVGTTVQLGSITILNLDALGLLSVDTSAIGALASITLDRTLCVCAISGTLTQSSIQDIRAYAATDGEVTAVVGTTVGTAIKTTVTLAGAQDLVAAGVVKLLGTTKPFDGQCPNNPDHSVTLCGSCEYNCASGYERCGGKCVTIGTCPSGVPRVRRRALNVDLMCSSGLTACAVPGRPGKTECMNTASDVESCGGCEFPLEGREKGVDCTAIANVDAVLCLGGRCVVRSCRKGFVAIGDGCVAR